MDAAQQRVIELVSDLPPERAELRVPACPDWTVRDLLSHMVGLGADVVAGDEPDDHNAAWTAQQVEARRDRDVAALVAEWQELAEPLRAWMRANTVRPLGDVIIHEQDLRGALGVPGGQDTEGCTRSASGSPAGSPGASRTCRRSRWSATRGRGPPPAPDDAATVLRAPDFDLARALVTRRSAAQLGAGRCAATWAPTSTPSPCSARCPRPT